jgi:hypothetical protein
MSEEALDELLQHGRLLQLRPDESLIFKFDAPLIRQQAADIYSHIADRLPPSVRFLIIGSGIEVSVVREESQ